VFSELCPFGPLLGNAQALSGPVEDSFREMAIKYGIWLLSGSMFEGAGDCVYNTASVIDPQGNIVGRYGKMSPFQTYQNNVASGDEFLVFDAPEIGRFGVYICYDMWFPETSRTLAKMEAEVILHPTMMDTIDRDVELSIARAIAVANQCYFFDVNGLGDGGVGSSIIVGPSGYVIHQADGAEETIPVEFPAYQKTAESETYLQGLGPLVKPERGANPELIIHEPIIEGEQPY